MPVLDYRTLQTMGADMLHTAGLPKDQAQIAVDHLVESNLVGHDSHGVIRIPGYVYNLRQGNLRPVGQHKIVRETPSSAVVDANHAFGIVLAYEAMQMAVRRAKQYTFGAIAVHHSGHIGRLGAYPTMAADQNCIGVVLLNGGARFTAPFGGTGRRLPPNPLAISVPTPNGPPLMLDITTSIAAGGKVDVYRARGQAVPDGWLVDETGATVNDPEMFRSGVAAMLPLGGPLGHKGYGLAMMIDAIAGGLSWAGCSAEQPTRGGSGYIALAIDIASFTDPADFKQEVGKLVDWTKSSPTLPGVDRIYVPGEIEERTRQERMANGISIESATWQALTATAAELGLRVPSIGED